MSFSNGQLVQAADLNNFSVDTVTTTGAVTVGTTLGVTGTSTLGTVSAGAVTGTTVTSTGQVVISGASAGQIVFPAAQNASANANTLDDYEEGTWTPTIGGSGGQSGQAYSTQVGWYVKVGRLVTAGFRVQLSTLGTITTDAQVQGLPFTSANVANQTSSCTLGRWQNMTTSYVDLAAVLAPNSTAMTLSGATGTATQLSLLLQADLSATTILEGTISYIASS